MRGGAKKLWPRKSALAFGLLPSQVKSYFSVFMKYLDPATGRGKAQQLRRPQWLSKCAVYGQAVSVADATWIKWPQPSLFSFLFVHLLFIYDFLFSVKSYGESASGTLRFY